MSKLFPYVSINGKTMREDQAYVKALNNGLLFGDGIFTTMKVKQTIPLFFERHQKRLLDHMKDADFSTPFFHFSLDQAVRELIKKNNQDDCAVRITVINEKEQPLVLIHQRDIAPKTNPVSVITVSDTRDNFKTIKSINRLVNHAAQKKAEANGATDALFVLNGQIIESTICNIFSLNKKSKIITPDLDGTGLKGIIRGILLENITVSEESIPEKNNGPLVLVNCLRTIKVSKLNGRILPDAEPLYQKIKDTIEKTETEYVKNDKTTFH